MHSLLRRQLKRHFGDEPALPETVAGFIALVDAAYQEFDSDRKMLERSLDLSSQELLQANSEMRAIFRAFPDIFFRLRRSGEILDCKGGNSDEFWLTPEKLIGRRIQEAPDPKVGAAFADAIQRVGSAGTPVAFTYEFTKDGQRLQYEARLLPVLDDQLIAIIRNITELKQAADEIAHQRSFLRQIIDLNPNLIFAKDREGRFTLVNQAVAAAYGTTVEALLGRTDADFNEDEEQVARFRRDDLEVIDSGREKTILEERLTDAAGALHWLQTIKRPLLGPDGRPHQVLGVATDITQRKAVEQALQEAERRAITDYESLLDRLAKLASDLGHAHRLIDIYRALSTFALVSTPGRDMMVWLLDENGATESVAYARREGVELDTEACSQVPRSATVADRALEAAAVVIENEGSPETAEAVSRLGASRRARLLAPMSSMGRQVGSIEVGSRSGGVFKQEHSTAMRMAANLAANAIENVRLIERERLSAERLRLAQKMEAVGRLAGGVAHDFNNILSVILGYANLIGQQAVGDPQLRDQIGQVETAANRAATLTRQLLAFSRMQVLDPKVLDLQAVVSDLEKMLGRLIGETIEFSTWTQPGLWRVKADRGQLEQVIMNLVVNARDAMPQGGTLRLRAENVTLDERHSKGQMTVRPGPYVRLSITDTGTGIDPAVQEKIFEPFFTTKELGKGTGLGLATVYGIVKQSDGYIWVDSEAGQGATFSVFLPRVDAQVSRTEQTPVATSLRDGQETVLLVEDEQGVRDLVRLGLQEAGYTVLVAGSADEAQDLEQGHSGPIELLLTDVVLPGRGGKDLAATLKARRPGLRVLYMSGYTNDPALDQNLFDKGRPLLTKPFTIPTLCKKIRQVLDVRKPDVASRLSDAADVPRGQDRT